MSMTTFSALAATGASQDAVVVLTPREIAEPVQHHKFTCAEFLEMHRMGLLGEQDKVELIFGEIVRKMVVGDLHIGCINWLTEFLVAAVAGQATISVQNALGLSDSFPEPDISVLKPSPDYYRTHRAGPADALLIIEVADSSLAFDRNVKGPLYASEGVPEYWIVNLNERLLEVNRLPQPDGTYADRRIFKPGEASDILLLPQIRLPVEQLF